MARDLAGTAAAIATRLAEQKISIESIVQRHPDGFDAAGAAGKASPVPVILITYATSEDAVYRALQAVQGDKVIRGRPQVIRIEKNGRARSNERGAKRLYAGQKPAMKS